ncbi:MAG: cobalamin-independent methionine synthase II family protein [Alphaproteobacteria bacterium]|nr:cobalamin-independent methionine synthase II family protein [Alphaproteobacteria bacterium]
MKRSDRRILTTHVGSLPRPDALLELNRAKFAGGAYDEAAFATALSAAVDDVCRKQAEIGIDVVNDGEFGKTTSGAVDYGAWSSYAWGRLAGWERGEPGRLPALAGRRDRMKFVDFYAELDATSFRSSSSLGGRPPVFTGPISYVGQRALSADLANFKTALAKTTAAEGFMTSVAPGSFARRQNRYYASDEEFLHALGEAMREEYRAIIEAGFVLQLDDPGLPDSWDMANPEPTVEEYKKFATVRVEALNHALRGLPEDRIRYHICWGSWHGPHSTDLPLASIVDVLLLVHAGAFSVEAGNVRHAHEWKVWRDVKLPGGKILIPGVVSHATNVVEHPELVADRIVTFARVVGRENVIAGTDCGLGGRIHPQLAWAKLEALVAGARLATQQLWL